MSILLFQMSFSLSCWKCSAFPWNLNSHYAMKRLTVQLSHIFLIYKNLNGFSRTVKDQYIIFFWRSPSHRRLHHSFCQRGSIGDDLNLPTQGKDRVNKGSVESSSIQTMDVLILGRSKFDFCLHWQYLFNIQLQVSFQH